jgi:hypothetical protein
METSMAILGNGLITLVNGFLSIGGRLASVEALCAVMAAVALFWLALLEVDELNRQGTKPTIGRH